jgi:peptidoglycan/LPS O-acetylase OafA/YrhL
VSKRIEFPYLDGLRGLAALSVVLYHTFLYTGERGDAYRAMPTWSWAISSGYVGVAIFIVLSGYLLMLPVATNPDGLRFRRGTWDFVKRRSRRILPPYYFSLLMALVLIWFVPIMGEPRNTQWDTKIPVTTEGLVSHLLMVHNLDRDWFGEINGPLWSVAAEFQIYFIMALVLLPLFRLVPPSLVVLVTAVWTGWLAIGGSYEFMHPWYICLFAAGMWAAQLTLRPGADKVARWVGLALLLAAPVALFVARSAKINHRDWLYKTTYWPEMALGLAVAALLVWAGHVYLRGDRPAVLRLLSSAPLLRLGLFSYTLYLCHSPLIGLANLLLLPLGLSTVTQYFVLTFLVVPVVMVICYGFYLLVERHFLNTRQRHVAEEEQPEGRPAAT